MRNLAFAVEQWNRLSSLRGWRQHTGDYHAEMAEVLAQKSHNEAHCRRIVDELRDSFSNLPTVAELRNVAMSTAPEDARHGCEICQNSARMVTDLYLLTFIPNTFRSDPRQPSEIVQRNWRSEWDDTPETRVLRVKLGANQQLIAGARPCACTQKGTI